MQQLAIDFAHTEFIADSRAVLFWPKYKSLILSDLHFGKATHFRKMGVNVPQKIFKEDLIKLIDCISFYNPQDIIIVGDLFHSHKNSEIEIFKEWRLQNLNIKFNLIGGNHDVYTKHLLEDIGLHYFNELIVDDIVFVHDEKDNKKNVHYFTIAGHWHPAVKISGKAKQNLVFPCFYLEENKLILPAFSKFSGFFVQEKSKKNKIIALVNNKLVCL
jgi:DNA ligase-associated metallophosphoesterase